MPCTGDGKVASPAYSNQRPRLVPSGMVGIVSEMLKDLLAGAFGAEYEVVEQERFRTAAGMARPDLAVVARSCYEREVLFRPDHAEGLNIVPVVVVVLDFENTGFADRRERAASYFPRGTAAVCFAEPDSGSIQCFLTGGSSLEGTIAGADDLFRRLLPARQAAIAG